jgi:hypothetical protein
VFSGRAKRLRAGKETLDEIRSKKGSQKVKRNEQEEEEEAEQEEQKQEKKYRAKIAV